MSDLSKTESAVDTKEKLLPDVSTVQGLESSEDSSSDSGSSESEEEVDFANLPDQTVKIDDDGSKVENQANTTIGANASDGSNDSGSSSDGSESGSDVESSTSSKSNSLYKSFVEIGQSACSNDLIKTPVLKIPVVESGNDDVISPVIITPGKSLESSTLVPPETPVGPHGIGLPSVNLALPPTQVLGAEFDTSSSDVVKSGSAQVGVKIGTGMEVKVEPKKPSTTSAQESNVAPATVIVKKVKKVKKSKSDKKKELEMKMEKLDELIKIAETDKQIREKKQEIKQSIKRSKLAKQKKAKKAKIESQHPNDEKKVSSSSEQSVSPVAPKVTSTSSRIPRIPEGRRFQKIAMSRVKELGLIRDGSIHLVEITEALRKIDSVEFKVKPTHAYRRFFSVPGTWLPHIRCHLNSFQQRYGAIVKAIAKMHLIMARNQLLAKNGMVNQEQVGDFTPIQQFENDLARAPSTPDQPSSSTQSDAASTSINPTPAKQEAKTPENVAKSVDTGKSVKKNKKTKESKEEGVNDPPDGHAKSKKHSKNKNEVGGF